jgi:hypothetical protein
VPDPVLIVTAMTIALAVSAALVGTIGWPWRLRWSTLTDAGWTLGIAAGFFLGCLVLGIRSHWPPRDDQDRLLVLVLPAVLAVELLAAFPKVNRWLVWPLRLAVVVGVSRILLHGTSYIMDLAGPGTREWSPARAWLIFLGLATLAGIVWSLLSVLARRAPGPSVPLSLAVVSAGAAVTIMLSGYATGGQIGLPLAAAIIGAMLAMLVLTRSSRGTGPLGLPIIGLFSLLVIGRFFSELAWAPAILLFCAPLLGWLTELRYVRRLPVWVRGLACLILVGTLVSAVVVYAQRKFVDDSQATSGSAPQEPSVQDYINFGR